MRTVTRWITAASACAGLALLVAGPAAAGTTGPIKSSCSGTRVETQNIVSGQYGDVIGRVELWYSSSAGGTNCVKTYNYQAGGQYTKAFLEVDDNHDYYAAERWAIDEGVYNSYAGASYLTSTGGKCINWGGEINGSRSPGDFGNYITTNWVHCG